MEYYAAMKKIRTIKTVKTNHRLGREIFVNKGLVHLYKNSTKRNEKDK